MSHCGKILETCHKWKESKCQKGDKCNPIYFNQKKPLNPRDFHPNKQNFHKQGYRPRDRRSHSGSPDWYHKSIPRGCSPVHCGSTVALKKIINLEDLYANIDSEEPPRTADQLSQNDAAIVSKIQSQISKRFFDPETKKLIEKALKSPREDQSKKELEEQNSEDEEEDRLGLDLEEVGEEVDDMFTKSMTRSVDDPGESNFQANMQGKRRKEREAGSNPSPPKSQPGSKSPVQPLRTLNLGFHTDWELKSALGNPSQAALEKEKKMSMALPPIITGGGREKPGSSSLWTPALDRRMEREAKFKTQMVYQDKGSNWEVETPYIGRKEKCELKDVVSTKPIHRSTERKTEEESTLFPSAMSHSLHVSSSASGFGSADRSNFMDFRSKEKERLPSCSPEPVSRLSWIDSEDQSPRASSESPRRHQKEKKKKRKKESSSSESESSDGEERRDEQRVSQEKEELRRGINTLLTRKESLAMRVKLLLEQKNMMYDLRHDILKNYKGNRAALTDLLNENAFLIKTIRKQVSNVHNMIERVEEDIDIKQEVLRKVSKPVFRDKPNSPHQSKERQRKLLYSPEREKYRKASYYNQVNEGKSSPVREDRSIPGYRKESPPAGYNKHYRFTEGPSEPTSKRSRMLQQGDEKWSRSPSGQRLPPGISKESGGRHLASSPDSHGSTSPPSKVRVAVKVEKERLKDGEEGRGQYTSKVSQKSYSRHMEQEGGRKETETEPSARMLSAPHHSQGTFMRYVNHKGQVQSHSEKTHLPTYHVAYVGHSSVQQEELSMDEVAMRVFRKVDAKADQFFEYPEFKELLAADHYNLVVLMIGGNDVSEATDVSRLVRTLLDIHSYFENKGVTCVMCTIEEKKIPVGHKDYMHLARYRKIINCINRQLKYKLKTKVIMLGGKTFTTDMSSRDGLHPNWQGREYIWSKVKGAIQYHYNIWKQKR